MSHLFQYAVLRYMHDSVTQEFVNIGVLLFAPQQKFLDLRVSHKYKRISQMFDGVEPLAYRRARSSMEKAVKRVANDLGQSSLLETNIDEIENLLPKILPENDSALSFSIINGGITDNFEDELNYLYHRFVEYYIPTQERKSRTDEEVWHEYVQAFQKRNILSHLRERDWMRTYRERYASQRCLFRRRYGSRSAPR